MYDRLNAPRDRSSLDDRPSVADGQPPVPARVEPDKRLWLHAGGGGGLRGQLRLAGLRRRRRHRRRRRCALEELERNASRHDTTTNALLETSKPSVAL